MSEQHLSFADLLDFVQGHEERPPHLDSCEACRSEIARARGFIATGVAALEAPAPERRHFRLAQRALRSTRANVSVLRVVIDSLQEPVAQLRAGASAPRFLRLQSDDVSVDLTVTPARRGRDLEGVVESKEPITEVALENDRGTVVGPIDAGGAFHFRGVARGAASLAFGSARIYDLEL